MTWLVKAKAPRRSQMKRGGGILETDITMDVRGAGLQECEVRHPSKLEGSSRIAFLLVLPSPQNIVFNFQ
jgi:hypothetical protein